MPIMSLDSGMTFERDTTWFGAAATQTLEPRLYYLYVPYKNQDLIPNFDSGVADFNFAQSSARTSSAAMTASRMPISSRLR